MIALRRAEAGDVPLILRFLADMAAESGGRVASSEASLLAHGFGPSPRFHGLIAEADGPLGMILYFPEYSTWRGEMGLFVQDIYIAPEGRGLGIGRRLMAGALEHADWAPQFLTLMVGQGNAAARGFYEALGLRLRDRADQLILEGEGLAALRLR